MKQRNKVKKERTGAEGRLALAYAGLVIGSLALGGLLLLVLPQSDYSPLENRYLTKRPAVTVDGIMSGEVQDALTEAASDQFPLRDGWMKLATTSQYLLYHREVNGVYIGQDGALFNKVVDSDLSGKNYRSNLGYVTAMAEQTDADVSVMLIPSPATLQKEKLPRRGVTYDSAPYEMTGETLCEADSVRFVQVREEMERRLHEGKKLYFNTDHHWTTDGAYIGAAVYLSTQDKSIAPREDFDVQTASDAFYGTIYSKIAGLSLIRPEELALPRALPEVVIETDGPPADALAANGEKTMPALNGIYDESKLSQKDKYAVYFGGNYGRLTIKNPAAAGKGTLLLVKDSYANSMVPYLLDHYEQITMIDLRYYNESVPALTAQGYDEILVCYEMSNFINDRNVVKLIR